MPAKKSTPKPISVDPTKPAKKLALSKSVEPAALASPSDSSKQRAYPALVHELLARLPLTLFNEERAYYEGSITEAEALTTGARHESSGVLDDLLQLVSASLLHVVAGKVAGDGSLRLRYHVELGEALAAKVDRLDTSLVEAVGATAAKTTSLHGTRSLRRAKVAKATTAGAAPQADAPGANGAITST